MSPIVLQDCGATPVCSKWSARRDSCKGYVSLSDYSLVHLGSGDLNGKRPRSHTNISSPGSLHRETTNLQCGIMERDVVYHGDLIEFRSRLKCEACQFGNHTCVAQRNTDRCISCDGAGVTCIFARTLSLKGPKAYFEWEWLLNEIPTHLLREGIIGDVDKPPKRATSKSFHPPRAPRSHDDLVKLWRKAFLYCRIILRFRQGIRYKKRAINEESRSEDVVRRDSLSEQKLSALSFSSPLPGLVKRSLQEENTPDFLLSASSCSSKAGEGDHASGHFGVFMLDSTKGPTPFRKSRHLTEEGRKRANNIRRSGACAWCRKKKRRVWILHEHDFGILLRQPLVQSYRYRSGRCIRTLETHGP